MTGSVSNRLSTAFSQKSLNLAHWLMKSEYDVQMHKHESIRHCCQCTSSICNLCPALGDIRGPCNKSHFCSYYAKISSS